MGRRLSVHPAGRPRPRTTPAPTPSCRTSVRPASGGSGLLSSQSPARAPRSQMCLRQVLGAEAPPSTSSHLTGLGLPLCVCVCVCQGAGVVSQCPQPPRGPMFRPAPSSKARRTIAIAVRSLPTSPGPPRRAPPPALLILAPGPTSKVQLDVRRRGPSGQTGGAPLPACQTGAPRPHARSGEPHTAPGSPSVPPSLLPFCKF